MPSGKTACRAEAIGFPTYRYQLILFIISGAIAGLAGALMANQQNYISPNLLHWTQSGTLMVMVIIGGVRTLFGGALGALALLVMEEVAADYTTHWQFYVGWILLAVVLFAPRGLMALKWSRGAAAAGASRSAGGAAGIARMPRAGRIREPALSARGCASASAASTRLTTYRWTSGKAKYMRCWVRTAPARRA
jgi:ribose/xylose/arabinose/galactoside ABC-type transport system permease subunit